MATNPQLINMTDRVNEVRYLPDPPPYVRERLQKSAAELDRSGDFQIGANIVMEALQRFTALVYAKNELGQYANVLAPTDRLRVAGPWGADGWQYWGLRQWEARVLRAILMERSKHTRIPALYDYNAERKTWHVDLFRFSVYKDAVFYLEKQAITPAEWGQHYTKFTAQDAKRRAKGKAK